MAVELVDRLAIFVAARRFLGMGVAHSRSLRSGNHVCMQHYVLRNNFPFRRYLGHVRREFMQHLFVALHGTLSSYLRDALHEGSANVVACLLVPWA
jgi:hypothetical protein